MMGSVATEDISTISILLRGDALLIFPEIMISFLEQENIKSEKMLSKMYFFIVEYIGFVTFLVLIFIIHFIFIVVFFVVIIIFIFKIIIEIRAEILIQHPEILIQGSKVGSLLF